MPTLAEQLIKSFHALGVRYVFGIPGGPSIPYLDAMRNNGIEFILVANEQSAAIMADVFGRLTGIPGVCHATFGPGATNLSTGIGGALLDRSPVIALTTEVKDAEVGRRVQMNIDHQALYQPITKRTFRMTKGNFTATATDAFRIATSGVPGPVHIGLPADIDGEMLDSGTLIHNYEKVPFSMPDPSLFRQVATLLMEAKKPVLAVGLTAVRLGLHKLIQEFVDNNNIPVVLTPMAKGVIPEDHPCYAGVLFHAKSDMVASIYRKADLVIGIGYDSIEFNYESWMPNVPLVHIDVDPVDITPDYHSIYEITGNVSDTLSFLNSLKLPEYHWDFGQIQENKAQLFQALVPVCSNFSPSDLITTLREIVPQDTILTSDVGAHLHLLGQLWKTGEPNRFLITNGWSAMGFGIPAAIGAKLCQPSSTVICVTGDGGFLMNCGELLTARRLGLHIVVVVLCDRSLGLIDVKQQRQNLPQYGTDLYVGEYFGSDSFLGVPVLKARDQEEMRASLQKGLSMSGPVIIEALIDGSVYEQLIAKDYK
ncbi:thiamine pyrophosphate-binding protein [Sporomusa sphaeroides]|uniref:Acetolactate synthase isozyme 1 large subunit n=1 Tax=Sporomusa sphaeroides DSM 2875 TaxID=1337886 RepID=A0ABP2C795_9FIRM|nr:thiamine pyrophosphate-binding protein [Sporomusa sphaeroides]OLS58743.1 acetolactate synthase isozyme 1 large subunit [Sporomusa sphaeroides DSM 2875]CVK19747.1 Acetolactate synthase isozyme 1 large subunit [Sporomusa sphaeroides DSM 2875]